MFDIIIKVLYKMFMLFFDFGIKFVIYLILKDLFIELFFY